MRGCASCGPDSAAAAHQILNQTKRTYSQERTNLEYMRTDEYKIQQGMSKYGWHYPADTIIADDSSVPIGANE